MSVEMIAYCGLDCSECPAYIAKRTEDKELRARTAAKWSSPSFPVAPEDISCDGCKVEDGHRFKWCESCDIRNCASERQVRTCAHCPDYTCGKLQKLFETIGGEARDRLQNIRNSI